MVRCSVNPQPSVFYIGDIRILLHAAALHRLELAFMPVNEKYKWKVGTG